VQGPSEVMPGALALVLDSSSDSRSASKSKLDARAMADPKAGAMIDSWGGAKLPEPAVQAQPYIRVTAVSQVTLAPPPAPDECEPHALLAPNGEPWPQQSGYVAGFLIGNKGEDLQLTVDNAANATPVYIKLYELDRRSNVRHLFILPHEKLTIDQLAFGKYEVRYQQVDLGAAATGGCGKTGKPFKNVAAQKTTGADIAARPVVSWNDSGSGPR